MRRSARGVLGFLAGLALALDGRGAHAQDGAPAAAIRLLVMADDLGAAHGFNQGTFAAHRDGVVSAANVIVPGPWFPEVASLAAAHPDLDLGVHLALTSEWEGLRWRPLTYTPGLADEDGFLPPAVWPRRGGRPGHSVIEQQPTLAAIEGELRAQIEQARRHIPRISYLWGHMGVVGFSKEMRALCERLADEYGLVLFERLIELGLARPVAAGYRGSEGAAAKADKLARRLEALEPGTWYMVDHCATDTPEIRALGLDGYRDVAADRAGVVAMWTDARVKEVVRRRGIRLIGVRDLLPEYQARLRAERRP